MTGFQKGQKVEVLFHGMLDFKKKRESQVENQRVSLVLQLCIFNLANHHYQKKEEETFKVLLC